MSNLKNKQIIKQGKIIENHLVGFPQYLDVKKNSAYKLIINDGTNRTALRIKTETNNITISCTVIGTNYIIDWGDKNSNSNTNTNSHTFKSKGEYTISIIGNYTYFILDQNFKNNLIKIQKLGDKITSLENMFSNCTKLYELPNEPLNNNISSCVSTFIYCTSLSSIPEDFTLPIFCENFDCMFTSSNIKNFNDNYFALPPNTTSIKQMFAQTKIKSIPKDFFYYCNNSLQYIDYCFSNCSGLINVDEFNPINLPQLKNIQGIFNGCSSIKKLNPDFNINYNITNLWNSFRNCYNLQSIGNLYAHSNVNYLNYTFYNCSSLNIDIRDFLKNQLKNNCQLSSTFYNCNKISGYIPAWYLWKSNFNTYNYNNTFYNCNKISGYIPTSWGGLGTNNVFSYFQININNPNQYYYILPIHKYYNTNQEAKFNFQINYGDNDIWYNLSGVTSSDYDFWVEDQTSIFYNYPKTIEVLYKNLSSLQLYPPEDQYMKYLETINQNSSKLEKIIHKYEKPGKYIITISGTIDSLFVHEQDVITNSILTKLFSIQNLKLKSYNHAFCNACLFEALPNETLSSSIADYMFYLDMNYKNNVQKIPTNFKLLSTVLSSANYMFHNFFTHEYINVNNNILPEFTISGSSAIGMFYNCTGLTGTIPSRFYLNSKVNLSSCFYNCYNLSNYKNLPLSTIFNILNPNQPIFNVYDFYSLLSTWNIILSTDYYAKYQHM